jgi:hypothetical protein
MDDAAKQTYDAFELDIENKIENENLEITESYCGQLPNITVRIACLFRLSRLNTEKIKDIQSSLKVEKCDVDRAIKYSSKVWSWFEKVVEIMKSTEKTKSPFTIESAKNAVLECLTDGSEKHVEVIKDYVIFRVKVSPATFYNALSELIKDDGVEKVKQGFYRIKIKEDHSRGDTSEQ